ncbi:MAG: hypothetical protein K9J85_02495 [Desulfobacteraceae bacterium]|nr:hypothetical protein [Desulfobacteraceae bacterium]
MGKKSLTKSTTNTKKNAAAKKKATTKKTSSKKPSLKTLRKKKFETWSPEVPYAPPPDPNREKNFSAPELTGDYDPAEAEKIRTLLFRQIDLSAPEPEKEPEKTGKKQPIEGKGPGDPHKGRKQPPEPPGPPGGGNWEPPISRGMLGLIITLVIVFALLIGTSVNNMGNYYLKQTNTGLEIWRGEFAPNRKEKIVTLRGVKAPEPIKDQYTREEALALAFDYFMEKADEIAETQDLPNLGVIRDNLEKAKKYAVTEKQKQLANRRLDRIDFLVLLYRADVAAQKQTRQGYETALKVLEQAKKLELTEDARQTLQLRINRIQKELEGLTQETPHTGDSK